MSHATTVEYHITSLVIHAAQQHQMQLQQHISALAGAEVHACTADGKMIVTVEGESQQAILDQVEAINGLRGVLSSSLIYHQVDQHCH
ncbi:chaperone NapD [Shewanella sp. A3A]|nr:chaperone NapD [Shewanella ferrihydritica]